MFKKKRYRKGVFIVIYTLQNKNPEYLILKRNLHWKGWEFPKGGIEKEEPKLDTVKREIYEETGLKPREINEFKKIGKYKYQKSLPDRPRIKGQTYKLFSARVKKNKIKLDKKEHSDYSWLNFEEALEKLTWPNQKKCLKIVHKKLRS